MAATTGVGKFRFTLDTTKLSLKQRLFYEENGYIVVKNLVDHKLLDACKQRFLDLCDRRIEKNGITLMKDISLMKLGATGEKLYYKAQDFLYEDVLFQYCQHPEILDYVSGFTGPNILAIHTMLINKPPDSGSLTSRHPLHQDLHYFPFRPADRIVCAWTAMEKITPENGCLIVIPGSHKGELHQHDYPEWKGGVNKLYHGVRGFDDHPLAELSMEKGDTVFFHPILIHGSGPNRTQGFRKAISCHYSCAERVFIDIRGTTQEGVVREIEELFKKFHITMDIKDFWILRSRLVAGRELGATSSM